MIPELELHHVHHFRVRAATADLQSPWSPPTSIMAGNPPPTAPTVTNKTSHTNGITLTWEAVPRADSYTVQQWDGPKNKWRFLPFTEEGQDEPYQVTINATPSATITNLTPTVTYSHRVFAINSNGRNGSQPVHTVAGGQSPTPAPSPTTTPPPAKMPPTNLQAQVARPDRQPFLDGAYQPELHHPHRQTPSGRPDAPPMDRLLSKHRRHRLRRFLHPSGRKLRLPRQSREGQRPRRNDQRSDGNRRRPMTGNSNPPPV